MIIADRKIKLNGAQSWKPAIASESNTTNVQTRRSPLMRMIMNGTLTREKQKASEMRKRGLAGKYIGGASSGAPDKK